MHHKSIIANRKKKTYTHIETYGNYKKKTWRCSTRLTFKVDKMKWKIYNIFNGCNSNLTKENTTNKPCLTDDSVIISFFCCCFVRNLSDACILMFMRLHCFIDAITKELEFEKKKIQQNSHSNNVCLMAFLCGNCLYWRTVSG